MATPTSSDFENGPLVDHGVTVTHEVNTVTIDNLTGDRQDSFATGTSISIVFENPNKVHELLNSGELETAEEGDSTVRAFVKGDVTISHEDRITWNSAKFRVESVSPRYFGANLIFKTIKLILVTP